MAGGVLVPACYSGAAVASSLCSLASSAVLSTLSLTTTQLGCRLQVEMAVPYADPNPPYTRKCAFDVGGKRARAARLLLPSCPHPAAVIMGISADPRSTA